MCFVLSENTFPADTAGGAACGDVEDVVADVDVVVRLLILVLTVQGHPV